MSTLPWDLDHRPLIVAAITPLRDDGDALDEAAIWPMAGFLRSHGADGVFACGTTGEGILLSLEERMRTAVLFRAALTDGLLLVHCGAQSTRDTMTLAAHAAEVGADGVAVIPPPYFALDDMALSAHFVAAARAAAPLPFFIYCFTARSGYPVPPAVIHRVADQADNLAGLKVSEAPIDRVMPYLGLDLPVLVGSEPLIPPAVAAGAAGSVSGLAAAFPDVVRQGLDAADAEAEARLGGLRRAMEAQPFIPAVKHVLGRRGVPVGRDVRRPLRPLDAEEVERLERALTGAGVDLAAGSEV